VAITPSLRRAQKAKKGKSPVKTGLFLDNLVGVT
jgi:hypothetical protein